MYPPQTIAPQVGASFVNSIITIDLLNVPSEEVKTSPPFLPSLNPFPLLLYNLLSLCPFADNSE